KLAVPIEDLDAGGEIDDVNAILRIDGGSARTDEIARLRTALAPNDLRLGMRSAAACEVQTITGQKEQGECGEPVPSPESAGRLLGRYCHPTFAFQDVRARPWIGS